MHRNFGLCRIFYDYLSQNRRLKRKSDSTNALCAEGFHRLLANAWMASWNPFAQSAFVESP